MHKGEELLQEIIKDMETAEKYLISAIADNSRFSRAIAIVEDNISEQGKTLIRARREIEKKKYGNKRHWVIKTQFIYNKMAEEQGLSNTWLSESKIKRDWKNYIFMVSEVAARLEDKPKKKRKKSVKRVANRGDKI